mgnify:CR=1 FL=1
MHVVGNCTAAAKGGDVAALCEMGRLHLKGLAVRQDKQLAKKYFARAMCGGSVPAVGWLGAALWLGR